METRSLVRIAVVSVAACVLAIAIPVGRALYLDAPHFAPDVNALTLRVYDQLASGRLDWSLYADAFNAAYTPAVLARLRPDFAAMGTPSSLTLLWQGPVAGGTDYLFEASYPAGDHRVEILVTPDGKVGSFRVKP